MRCDNYESCGSNNAKEIDVGFFCDNCIEECHQRNIEIQ